MNMNIISIIVVSMILSTGTQKQDEGNGKEENFAGISKGPSIFSGRTPCNPILSRLNNIGHSGCQRVKISLTLNENGECELAIVYVGMGNTKYIKYGNWNMTRGSRLNPKASVYRLSFDKPEKPVLLMKGDDYVLFFLDDEKNLLVGNAELSYTLNRSDR